MITSDVASATSNAFKPTPRRDQACTGDREPRIVSARPGNAFKPELHRCASHMTERACHVPGCALQFGST